METADLDVLASWVDRLAAPDFTIGARAPQHTTGDGVIQMPWFDYSDEVLVFLRDITGAGWIQPIDWTAWASSPAGRRMQTDVDAIDVATPEDLVRLLTTIVRGDRFSEGTIASAFERGILQRIARRATVLRTT